MTDTWQFWLGIWTLLAVVVALMFWIATRK